MYIARNPRVKLGSVPASEEDLIMKVTDPAYLCYATDTSKKTLEDRKAFVRKLIMMGHTSPLEHASITLVISTDRGVTHELVRHRIGAYSQESTRYCNYSKGKFNSEIAVLDPFPEDYDRESDTYDAWKTLCETSESAYIYLTKSGVAPDIARAVLPTCLMTTITVTYDIPEWRHVIIQRTDPHAHPMMRKTMAMCRDILAEHYPVFFGDLLR